MIIFNKIMKFYKESCEILGLTIVDRKEFCYNNRTEDKGWKKKNLFSAVKKMVLN
jgi:hypothetical protein